MNFLPLSELNVLGGLPRFKYWLRSWSANFHHFVREPRHIELCRDPRFDL